MSMYEHLLPIDPIGAFDKVKENYKRYFENAYRISNDNIDRERMEELVNDDNLYKEPYLELLPEYKPHQTVTDVSQLAPEFANEFGNIMDAQAFFEFIKKGLMNYPPYGHQVEMLQRAFSEKKNVVITSGTGSGKTESFLLPLFAQIYSEAVKEWIGNPWNNRNNNWHQTTPYEPCQRFGETRRAAVRALILYPMNALVEDQMARLRKALDSDAVRAHLDTQLGNNRIFFGGYNGKTIGQKNFSLIQADDTNNATNHLQTAQSKVNAALDNYRNRFEGIKNYLSALPQDEQDKKKDALYVSPRLDDDFSSEQVTRWDMQVTPPDILITNVSMLSIMLMRQTEASIFKQTKEWLAEDRDNHIFTLVVDELHMNRGTAGSEVACLIRMLYDALGLSPVIPDGNGGWKPNHQIRILASSASLGQEPKEGQIDQRMKFLEDFFGIYSTDSQNPAFYIQGGSDYKPTVDGFDNSFYQSFKQFDENFLALNMVDKKAFCDNFATSHEYQDIYDFIEQTQEKIFADFIKVLPKNDDGSLRPIALHDLYEQNGAMFHNEECGIPNSMAIRGFLIFRGFVDSLPSPNDPAKKYINKLPRIRFHQFFKYIEGLWGELNGSNGGEVVQNLSYASTEIGPNNHKVLELLRCESCGELFIGGNRKQEGTTTAMTLNYPDLSKIPNFNPTPMVQNKSYADYVIFWPSREDFDESKIEDKVALLKGNRTGLRNNHAYSGWGDAYLNCLTGELTGDRPSQVSIPGRLYKVLKYTTSRTNQAVDEPEKIQALPCCCPKCGANYTYRKYTKSPIRSFRTGIDRSNQLLSKELIYQLSEGSKKLIGFSDSRQDAAKQALGIEKEHYRDMVRMLFVQTMAELRDGFIKRIQDYINDLKASISNPFEIPALVKKHFGLNDAEKIAQQLLFNITPNSIQFIPLKELFGNGQNVDGVLTRKLVQLGINPSGVAYAMQTHDTDMRYHWSEAFNVNTGLQTNPQDTDPNYYSNVKSSLIAAVCDNSFGKYMGVSVLDAGIGYICCSHDDSIKNEQVYTNLQQVLPNGLETFDFVDAFIRILGDSHRYPSPDEQDDRDQDNVIDTDEKLYKKFKAYFEAISTASGRQIANALYRFLTYPFTSGCIISQNGDLFPEHLFFRFMDANATYVECPKCHRVHPNVGLGCCTYCKEPIIDPTCNTKLVSTLHGHYISHDILTEPRNPEKLHCEELTGQTDDIQQRLLEFKDLIFDSSVDPIVKAGYQKTKPIDMVNVTTTMEAGVDIGSLEAIFQGNMSPTRFNYQQRVGRGGRRGQAFSAAFTFCRGRSHDVHYYKNATDEIIGSQPVPPSICLSPFQDATGWHMKQAIMRRVIVKMILRKALDGVILFDYTMNDTAGEFGRVAEWSNNRDYVDAWLKKPGNVDEVVDTYYMQFNQGNIIENDVDEIKSWINKDLLNDLDQVCARNQYRLDEGFATCLAQAGYLPLYGLPSNTRNFYHGFDNKDNEIKSIDRDLEMAISEFAPGQEKTKDKGVYRVEGLTLPMKNETIGYPRGFRFISGNDALSDLHVIKRNSPDPNSVIDDIVPCDQTETADEKFANLQPEESLIVIPKAFRSCEIKKNQGRPKDNNDRGSNFAQTDLFAKDDPINGNTKKVDNVTLSLYGLSYTDNSEVWHINSNNGNLYSGLYTNSNNYVARPIDDDPGNATFVPRSNFMFYDRDGKRVDENNTEAIKIALGAKKSTEMVKLTLDLEQISSNLNLDVETGNKSAIRAAFLSAAYLLQRTLADHLDVQPDDIEVIEKVGSAGCPEIYLCDALPNGASIVSYLFEADHMKEILEDITEFRTSYMQSIYNHASSCATACQNCMLTYTNRGVHHVLDWRLGVGILRLMIDSSYDFGFTNVTRTQFKELKDFDALIQKCADKKNWRFDEDKCYIVGRGQSKAIVHPLWNKEAFASSIGVNRIDDVYDTFHLLRSVMDKRDSIQVDNNTNNTTSNQIAQTQDPQTGIVLNVSL